MGQSDVTVAVGILTGRFELLIRGVGTEKRQSELFLQIQNTHFLVGKE